jgi:MFS family permease
MGTAGAIVSLFGAGGVAAALGGGVLADRIGRRATMAISLLGGAALMAALGSVTDPLAIAVLVVGLGMVGELYRPAVQAFVADVVPPEHRLQAFGMLYWAINLGFSIAPVAAGLVASWSYRALFFIDAATMAIYGAIVLVKVPETRPPPTQATQGERVSLGAVLTDGAFTRFLFFGFLVAFLFWQTSATLSAWMASLGHSARTYGAVLAVNGVLIVVAQPAITSRIATLDRSRVLLVSALLAGLGLSLHGVGAAIALHVLAVAIWTLAEILSSPTIAAVVSDFSTASSRGRYQGVYTMSWGLASFLGPLVGPFALERAGPAVTWGGCLVIGGVAAIGLAATTPRHRPTPPT